MPHDLVHPLPHHWGGRDWKILPSHHHLRCFTPPWFEGLNSKVEIFLSKLCIYEVSLSEVVVLWILLEKHVTISGKAVGMGRAYERMRFATSGQSTSAWFHYPSCEWVLLVASVKIEQIGFPFTAKILVIFGTLNSFATSSATSSIIFRKILQS